MVRRAIRAVLICLALGGCSTYGVMPSGPSISGGPAEGKARPSYSIRPKR